MKVQTLFGPVHDDIALVDAQFDLIKQVDLAPLAKMLDHVLAGGGKRIRPGLALLGGTFGDYDLDKLIPLAASIELLHTASLVHDDVIDAAATRRGRATANHLYDNAVSVMIGDFLFAHAADLVARVGSVRVVRLFARTLMQIVTGELDQDVGAFDASKRIGDYLNRIGGKTASLFGAACEGGAMATGAPEPYVEALRDYGYNLGVAFQIVDDILDFVGDEAVMGKPSGSDLMQGTLTLPSLLAMEEGGDKRAVTRLFSARRNKAQLLQEALDVIRGGDAIARSQVFAEEYGQRAIQAIATLPDTAGHRTLVELTQYVLTRDS
ncbi:MAG: polyprenyl synthetase family protein [Dehalococcoidia bacterium]